MIIASDARIVGSRPSPLMTEPTLKAKQPLTCLKAQTAGGARHPAGDARIVVRAAVPAEHEPVNSGFATILHYVLIS